MKGREFTLYLRRTNNTNIIQSRGWQIFHKEIDCKYSGACWSVSTAELCLGRLEAVRDDVQMMCMAVFQ